MRPSSIFLRVLLCLVLVANGTTVAFAATRMALLDDMSAPVQQDDAPPCHAMPMDDGPVPHDEAPAIPDSHEDCCGSACLCDCVAHASAILGIDAPAWAAQPAAAPVSVAPESRAGPALPHPIRPPIG